MSDENSPFHSETRHTNGLLQLGYLVQNQYTHPFSLTLQDLSNLFVIGPRAQDIYFNLLIQLCDNHRIPVLVVKGSDSESFENQVCECLLWHLDLETDAVTFDVLDLGKGKHASRQISILISLFEEFVPLSPTARNLLHVIIWQALLSASRPTLNYLQSTLSLYQHHNGPYYEIRRLFDAIPHILFEANYDNLALSRINHLPTIISTNDTPAPKFALNLLLLKLLAQEEYNLPPLFLVNPPDISPQLLQWLGAQYTAANSPFVIFKNQIKESCMQITQTSNFILTSGFNETPSCLHQELTEKEYRFLQLNSDHVVVRLRSEPVTRLIKIF